MPRVALRPGEDSIDKTTIHVADDGTMSLQWCVRLPNGKVVRRNTRGAGTKGELRRRAHDQAARLLTSFGSAGKWSSTSQMGEYVTKQAIPSVAGAPDSSLRPNSRTRYVRVLGFFAEEAKGLCIADAVRPRTLEDALVSIAKKHGTASAKQTSKVVNKYVMQPLVRDGVIASNPLRDFSPQLPERKLSNKAGGGQALTHEQRDEVIDYLLAVDPEETPAPKRGRYSQRDRAARRALVVDVTLLQAFTGLRISEVRLLRRKNVSFEGDVAMVTVTSEVSKTHRGRVIPVTDPRIVGRIRARLGSAGASPEAIVYDSPAAPGNVWDSSNAQKAIRQLYDEMAEALEIPLLHQVSSHVWRATLNTEWMSRGAPAEIRAAYFGHSAEVNREYYTDLTDIAPLVALLS